MGMVVIQPYVSVSKHTKTKTEFLRCTGYLNSTKTPLKQDLLLILGLVGQQSERLNPDGHGCHTALHFGVKANENQDSVPTLYWLPKLNYNPCKAIFIANSRYCTTT